MSSVKNSKQGCCENPVTPEGYLNIPRFMFMGPSPDETILSGVDKILSALKKNCIQMRTQEPSELSEIYSRKSSLTYSSATIASKQSKSDLSQPTSESTAETITSTGTSSAVQKPKCLAKKSPTVVQQPKPSVQIVEQPKPKKLPEDRGDVVKPYPCLKSNLKPPTVQCHRRDADIEKKLCEVFKIVRNPNGICNEKSKYPYFPTNKTKRIKTKSILTKLHVYDDTSKIVEIMKPKTSHKFRPRNEEYESIFVVLPNGASVGFLVLAKLKASEKNKIKMNNSSSTNRSIVFDNLPTRYSKSVQQNKSVASSCAVPESEKTIGSSCLRPRSRSKGKEPNTLLIINEDDKIVEEIIFSDRDLANALYKKTRTKPFRDRACNRNPSGRVCSRRSSNSTCDECF